MTSLNGTILITGANGGLGTSMVSRITTSDLAKDYHGVYTVRSLQNVSSLNDILRRAPSHKHDILALDLSSQAKIRETAALINKRVAEGSLPRIRALIFNAGYQDSASMTKTDDGFETNFQVNYLANFLLALLLLQSMDKEKGRILFVCSWSHNPDDKRNEMGSATGAWTDPKYAKKPVFTETEVLAHGQFSASEADATFIGAYRRYGASKLCVAMFMHELQKRISTDSALSNISVLGLDPGAMSTGLMRNASWWNRTLVMKVAIPIVAPVVTRLQPNGPLRTPSKSAGDAIRACFDTETLGERPKGVYLDGSEISETSEESRDESKRTTLWKDSVGYVNVREGDTVLQNWR